MITKEQWQQVRDMEEIPVFVWFEYYKEMGGILNDINEFQTILWRTLVKQPLMISKQGRPIKINFDTAVERLFDHYSNKFSE